MLFDKKKATSVILSKLGKDGRQDEAEVAPEEGEHDEYSSLAEDLMLGVKSGSVQKIASVLRALHEMIEEADEVQDQEG